MAATAGDPFAAELALDRLEAELARELPGHMRAFAAAYAAGTGLPGAPAAALHPSAIAIARRALVHLPLVPRALALLRLLAPIAIDADPAVARARARLPSWDALRALAEARDHASRVRFGIGAIEVMHRLSGSIMSQAPRRTQAPPAIPRWLAPCERLATAEVHATWSRLGTDHGASGTLRFVLGTTPRPRAFVAEPTVEVLIVLPERIDTPALRFAVLHELGHAVANLIVPAGLPRAVDEAVAAYVARLAEQPDSPWFDPDAAAARVRRTELAELLDGLERALPAAGEPMPSREPPWAVWHDPGAQAAYVTAESIAEQLWARLGPTPGPGALAGELAALRARIDGATVI